MKRVLILLVALGLLLPMAACGKKDEASSVASESTPSSMSASESASASASVAAPSSVAPVPEMMEGTFIAIDQLRYEDKNAPRFELLKDGTFTMKVNTGEGDEAGFNGTYVLTGNNLVLTVVERIGEDFLGQRITTLPFTKVSEDHFTYGGEPLGLTRAGDQFTRDGIAPVVPASSSAPAPQESAAQSGASMAGSAPSTPASPATSSSK